MHGLGLYRTAVFLAPMSAVAFSCYSVPDLDNPVFANDANGNDRSELVCAEGFVLSGLVECLRDADGDRVPADADCDDSDAAVRRFDDDADCDGVVTADDCDDADPALSNKADDTDCDGIVYLDDCDDTSATIGPCQHAGQTCNIEIPCSTGLRCINFFSNDIPETQIDDRIFGVCTARCNSNDGCPDNLVCSNELAGVCMPQTSIGDSCGFFADGGMIGCSPGQGCQRSSGLVGNCVSINDATGDPGSVCSYFIFCDRGLDCFFRSADITTTSQDDRMFGFCSRTCLSNDQCINGTVCSPELGGFCMPPTTVGSVCGNFDGGGVIGCAGELSCSIQEGSADGVCR